MSARLTIMNERRTISETIWRLSENFASAGDSDLGSTCSPYLVLILLSMNTRVCREKWDEYKRLAEDAAEQCRFEEAEEFWWLAIRQAEDAQSPQMVCMCLDGLGDLFVKQSRHHDSEPLYRESLHKKVAVLGENHPVVGRAYNSLAYSLYRYGKLDEAEHSLRQALMIFQDTLGLGIPEAQWSAKHLVRLLKEQGRVAESAEMSKLMDSNISDLLDQTSTGPRMTAALCEVCRRPYKGMQCLRCTQKGMSALRSLESSQKAQKT
jgi:tetratricopeptide (TPR) repeat protein